MRRLGGRWHGCHERIAKDSGAAARSSSYFIYSTDFDRIERLVPGHRYQDAWLAKLEEETRHMVGIMQKNIERMMAARSQSVKVPGFRSGRLNSAGLHRLFANDDRIFRRKFEAKTKDTAVGLLIDNSGSMSGKKQAVAMATGFALSQTLERVGIPHEVVGFTTGSMNVPGLSGRMISAEQSRIGRHFSRVEPLYMPIFKEFQERLTPEVKRRFASAHSDQDFLSQNADGECVEIATNRLLRRPEKRKVLIVLSDGSPSCPGVHADQLYKLHKAIKDAETQKVDLVGIGILSEAVRSFYPRHIVLKDLNSLPGTVMGELTRILTAI